MHHPPPNHSACTTTLHGPSSLPLLPFSAQNNLKKRYDAQWALVTGASSGIGRAIVEKLAGQGINVVMVALDDPLLNDSHKDLCQQYPKLKFIKLGCVQPFFSRSVGLGNPLPTPPLHYLLGVGGCRVEECLSAV